MLEQALTPLLLSLKVAFWASLFALLLGGILGYGLAKKPFWGHSLIDALCTLPMVLPPTVLGYYLLVLFGSQSTLGVWLEQYLEIQLIFTLKGAVVAATIVALPLIFKGARVAFESIPPDLEKAGLLLGLSPIAVFWRISLPLAWRGLLAGLMLAFTRCLGEFGATLMVAGSIPGETQTLSIAIYEAVQAGQDTLANVLVLIISITCIFILVLANWMLPGYKTVKNP
jgi:molybdate transport system permease protein